MTSAPQGSQCSFWQPRGMKRKFRELFLTLGCFVRKGDFCDRRTHMSFSLPDKYLNTSRFTWNIEAEPFRTQNHSESSRWKCRKTTQNYNAHQEKLAIQNHSEPFESPSNSRCPLRCRNQRNWTTGVCVCVCVCDCVWLSMPQRSNVTSSGSSLRVFSLRFPCVGCQVPLADLGSSSTESIAAL